MPELVDAEEEDEEEEEVPDFSFEEAGPPPPRLMRSGGEGRLAMNIFNAITAGGGEEGGEGGEEVHYEQHQSAQPMDFISNLLQSVEGSGRGGPVNIQVIRGGNNRGGGEGGGLMPNLTEVLSALGGGAAGASVTRSGGSFQDFIMGSMPPPP